MAEFQRRVVTATGGHVGILNRDALEAALARPLQSVFGSDLFPTAPDQIAALIHSIATTHPFVDGNKRTAMRLGLALAEDNGIRIAEVPDEEVEALALRVAVRQCSIPQIADWLTRYYDFP